jgi:hypothetical protein
MRRAEARRRTAGSSLSHVEYYKRQISGTRMPSETEEVSPFFFHKTKDVDFYDGNARLLCLQHFNNVAGP